MLTFSAPATFRQDGIAIFTARDETFAPWTLITDGAGLNVMVTPFSGLLDLTSLPVETIPSAAAEFIDYVEENITS